MSAVVTTRSDWQIIYRWVDRVADRACYVFRSTAHRETLDWADGFLAGLLNASVIDVATARAMRAELATNGERLRKIERDRTAARIAELTARPIGSRFD